MKILIVEDEDFSRLMLQEYLESLGHEIVAAANGAEAWNLVAREYFPIVITDWMMPELSGTELVRRIRAHSDRNYVYIIMLTSRAEKRDIVEGIMEGADDFLTKPYDHNELRVRIRAGERIIALERSLKDRNDQLTRAKTDLEVANDNLDKAIRHMKDDLAAAARIQRSLLPTVMPATTLVDSAWIFRPCDEIGGDIFDMFSLDESHVGFYLLDVVGHGVPAALLAVTLNRFLSPATGAGTLLVSSRGPGSVSMSPSALASALNQRFPMAGEAPQYFTLLLGVLNTETGEMRLVSAGHPPPLYLPVGREPALIEASGFPIGVVEQPDYDEIILQLSPGDRVLLYSDGVLDAEGHHGRRFGQQGLLECVAGTFPTIDGLVRFIDDRLMTWCGGRPQDDISLLAIGVGGKH